MAESMGTINSPAPRGAQHITESFGSGEKSVAPVSTTGEEKRQAYLAALAAEKQMYLARGAQARAKDVDTEIERVKTQTAAEFDSVPVPLNPGEPVSIGVRR
jgi:hypothetical protein